MPETNVLAFTRRSEPFNRNVADFVRGVTGRYEFSAHNMRVRGVLIESRDGKRQMTMLVFIPFDNFDTRKNETRYSRKKDKDMIRILHARVLGVGSMYVPDGAPISNDGADNIEEITGVIQAASTMAFAKTLLGQAEAQRVG